jgi:hypothetical protein
LKQNSYKPNRSFQPLVPKKIFDYKLQNYLLSLLLLNSNPFEGLGASQPTPLVGTGASQKTPQAGINNSLELPKTDNMSIIQSTPKPAGLNEPESETESQVDSLLADTPTSSKPDANGPTAASQASGMDTNTAPDNTPGAWTGNGSGAYLQPSYRTLSVYEGQKFEMIDINNDTWDDITAGLGNEFNQSKGDGKPDADYKISADHYFDGQGSFVVNSNQTKLQLVLQVIWHT